eukprot:TRINITY_DN11203_c0_g1_i1.p1 TRINITY_DN11203_c0_g1~~TRINITY_DN11203_c0_g1_i1.p1  ORF type:complete len:544 (-),score=200.87 TRINITY_DN11203_c0_g1_i1:52-1662(-)
MKHAETITKKSSASIASSLQPETPKHATVTPPALRDRIARRNMGLLEESDDEDDPEGLHYIVDDQEMEPLGLEDPKSFSSMTRTRSIAAKLTIEQYYDNFSRTLHEKSERRRRLEEEMEQKKLPDESKARYRRQLYQMESEFLRLRRVRLSNKAFESIKIIGRGAFGEVRLVRMKGTNDLYAMKKLKKSEMIKKDQVNHVLNERDVLADSNYVYYKNHWIVSLFFSFQDDDYLYLIMEYVPGGDMMTMLIKYDIFSEEMTRCYIAETILAIDSIHKLNYIHRDIKPDNLLIDKEGHIKLSDFGLCTGLETKQFSALTEKLHNMPDEMKHNLARSEMSREDRISNWKKKRRELAYSTVGTPDYIAPEVFRQEGYNNACDWWSVGVIMFEMLVGYPPFCAETPTETYYKIINAKKTLLFPDDCVISPEARDLIEKLLTDPKHRLGSGPGGVDEIKGHKFFRGANWSGIRNERAPMIPQLSSPIDTRYFEELDEEDDDHANDAANGVKDARFIGYTYNNFEALRAQFSTFPSLSFQPKI